jgi:hypothetical protein
VSGYSCFDDDVQGGESPMTNPTEEARKQAEEAEEAERKRQEEAAKKDKKGK